MRIAFANICMTLDFDSEEKAQKYKNKNMGKGWWFGEITYLSNNLWTMEVRKPYNKKYNKGW